MPTPKIRPNSFYVYALLREDGQTPFYIGKGGNDRWLGHEKTAPRGRSHKDRIIQQMIAAGMVAIPKIKLAENLSAAAAFQLEIDLIRLVGREPHGPLANRTAGGDGMRDPSPETLALLSALRSRPERIAALAAISNDPEVRKRQRAGVKAAWLKPEVRERHASADEIRNARPEEKARRSAANIRRWADPAARRRQSKALKAARADPRDRQRQRDISRARWTEQIGKAIHEARMVAQSKRRGLPTGVYKWGNRYRAKAAQVHIGIFDTVEEAEESYLRFKSTQAIPTK